MDPRINNVKFIPAVTWFFVVLVLVCLPGKDFPSNDWFALVYLDKWIHAGIFGLLALLFMLPVAVSESGTQAKLQFFVRIAIATSIWGLTTEFIQKYWIPGRSFDLMDWAADSVGAFISFVICWKRVS